MSSKNNKSKDIDIKIPHWPYKYQLKSKNVIDESGLGFYEVQKIRNKSMALFNKFKGNCLNSIIDIENAVDVLSLELIAPNDIKLKKDILYLFYRTGVSIKLGHKIQNFPYLVATKFYLYKELKETLDKIHIMMNNIVGYRNVLAHSYIVEEIINVNGKLKHIIIPYKYLENTDFVYSPTIKKQVLDQIRIVNFYLEFMYKAIEPANKEIDTRFLFEIGHYDEKYQDKRKGVTPIHIDKFAKKKKQLYKLFEPNYGVNPPPPPTKIK